MLKLSGLRLAQPGGPTARVSGLRLAQPGGPTARVSVLSFLLKTEEDPASET
jgi:hypothetical protein